MTLSTRTPATSLSNRRIPAGNLDPETFAPFGQVIQNPGTHDGRPTLEKVVANQGSATKWLDITRMRSWYELARSKKPASLVMNMFVCKPRKLRRIGDGRRVFDVKILERHPYTPQTFVPMGLGKEDNETYYLVIVAPTLSERSWNETLERRPPYPVDQPPKTKRSLMDRLLGARPSPFTNEHIITTTSTTSKKSLSDPVPKGTGPPDLDRIQAFVARGDQAVTYGPGTWHGPMVVLGEKPVDFFVVQYSNGVGLEDCQEYEITTDEYAVELSDAQDEVAMVKAKL